MAIGRTFKEAFQKGLRGARDRPAGLGGRRRRLADDRLDGRYARRRCSARSARRRPSGSSRSSARSQPASSVEIIAERTGIDPWFLDQLGDLLEAEREWRRSRRGRERRRASSTALRQMKRLGFSDRQLARLRGDGAADPRARGTRSASGRPTRWWTPAPASSPRPRRTCTARYDEESEAPRAGERDGGDPGQRAQPHRAGSRVRLLLRARGAGASASWATRR